MLVGNNGSSSNIFLAISEHSEDSLKNMVKVAKPTVAVQQQIEQATPFYIRFTDNHFGITLTTLSNTSHST